MKQILEQLYKNLNQAKESLHECAIVVADLGTGQNHEEHLEQLIEYNFQKGQVTGLEDAIHEVEKMISATKPLKAV
ncbi:hypothetical protein [Lysinibacillus xylanilyticus]|uniref:hypothetical protein n=1 Tax=Lysinibacillus xylanilyticus TaxID=582475 RepID=UPI003D086B8F